MSARLLFAPLIFVLSACLLPAGPLAQLWRETDRLLVLGEQHTAVPHARLMLGEFTSLHHAGMKHLALEIPRCQQPVLDEFVHAQRSPEWLSQRLWQMPAAELPAAYQLKLQLLARAREAGVRLWGIDAECALFHRLGTLHAQAADQASTFPRDLFAEQLFRARGPAPEIAPLPLAEARQHAWHLWLTARTEAMAQALRELLERHPHDRVVAIVGNLHADFAAFRGLPILNVIPSEAQPATSIELALPPALRSMTRTIVLIGGVTAPRAPNAALDLASFTALERTIIQRGLSEQLIVLEKTHPIPAGSLDAVIFLPLLRPRPAPSEGSASAQ